MLQEIFYWIFNMSITATVTGILVMLIRRIKKIPRRVTIFLWIIPFLRMVIPFGIDSPHSLMSLLSKFTTKTVVVYQPTNSLSFSMMNSIMAADSYFPITYKVDILEDIFGVAAVIWSIITLAVLLMLAVTYFSTIYELRDATCLTGRTYLSKKVLSPAVYGIVKPKIILPEAYQDRNYSIVALHETTHIRYLDNLWRLIAFVIVALHWFNPFCWLFFRAFLADMEFACDERVICQLGAELAGDYATALLENSQGKTVFASAFGGEKIRTRIENILSFRKMTWFSLAVFTAFLSVIFYALLTNAG